MSESTLHEYEVEKIVGKRIYKKHVQYLVKWKGYSENENTWEPKSHLLNCSKLIKLYEEEQKKKREREKSKFIYKLPPTADESEITIIHYGVKTTSGLNYMVQNAAGQWFLLPASDKRLLQKRLDFLENAIQFTDQTIYVKDILTTN